MSGPDSGLPGSPDTCCDPRGFAVKFYTSEGNLDIVGNNTPVFFIKDPLKFQHFICSRKRRMAHQSARSRHAVGLLDSVPRVGAPAALLPGSGAAARPRRTCGRPHKRHHVEALRRVACDFGVDQMTDVLRPIITVTRAKAWLARPQLASGSGFLRSDDVRATHPSCAGRQSGRAPAPGVIQYLPTWVDN